MNDAPLQRAGWRPRRQAPFLPPRAGDTTGLMASEYVKKVDEVCLIGGSRVSLDSLVYLFREGVSAEGMVESYPALTLEQVHGALAFYLANQDEVDAYLAEGNGSLRQSTSGRGRRMPS